MVEVKKENRMLKRRIEHLELQISHLTNHFDYQGNIEPTRTLVGFNKNTSNQAHRQNEFMSEQSPNTYYDNPNGFGGGAHMNYSNAPSSQNMRSSGFNRDQAHINSKHSLRENGRKGARRDLSMRNGVGKKGLK